MTGSQSARSRASNSPDDVLRKKLDVGRQLSAAGFKPDAFILKRTPLTAEQMRATVSQALRGGQRPMALPSAADALRRMPSGKSNRFPQPSPSLWESTMAGVRGLPDSLPLEAGNYIPAVLTAMQAAQMGLNPFYIFNRQLALERYWDRYDETVHPTARKIGKWTGTAVQMAALPAEGLLVKGGTRLAEAAPLLLREQAVMGGTAGGLSAASRGVTDYLQGKRSSAAEYAGDFVGGATDALLSRYGYGGAAGAAGGATGAAAADLFRGQMPSIENMRRGAVDGGFLALPAGMLGRSWSNGLSIRQKGVLGENLSLARTVARGDLPQLGPKRAVQVSGRKTFPDHRTLLGKLVEAKFGPKAKLSQNQTIALNQLGPDRFRVDAFLPRDVGVLTAYPAAVFGSQLREWED
jgi:hypothetical protein